MHVQMILNRPWLGQVARVCDTQLASVGTLANTFPSIDSIPQQRACRRKRLHELCSPRCRPGTLSMGIRCMNTESSMKVFDRSAKRIQKNRTASIENFEVYDYIKEEIGYRVADRICDVKRKFDVAVDLGCGRGYVSRNILEDTVGTLFMTDMAEKLLEQAEISPEVPTYKVHADEEFIPFMMDSLDLVVSSLSLHWVNDLPGTFKQVLILKRQIHHALKNDGCFMGSMCGGDTLFELRVSLQLAETEREGGFAPHISPFTSVQDLGNLLNRAGFRMLTIDIDEIVVNYPTMFELMHDLKGMGESNCAWSRRSMIPRDTLAAAAAVYKEMYGSDDREGVPATFQVINFIGWKPDPSQQQPAVRGSGQISIKDIDKLQEMSETIADLREQTQNNETKSKDYDNVEHLAKELERLRMRAAEPEDTEDNGDKDKR